ncbi:MAG: hypothetical protein NTX42_09050 [Methanothrix sp.]|nr:hypothetical protein [Methanothrix sp.]
MPFAVLSSSLHSREPLSHEGLLAPGPARMHLPAPVRPRVGLAHPGGPSAIGPGLGGWSNPAAFRIGSP